MNRTSFFAALFALLGTNAAIADQFVAELDVAFDGASPQLLASLKVVEVDAFKHDGKHYVVLDAPSEGYVEAYFFALGLKPAALHTLGADWSAPGLSSLSLENRLPFLQPTQCDFCLS